MAATAESACSLVHRRGDAVPSPSPAQTGRQVQRHRGNGEGRQSFTSKHSFLLVFFRILSKTLVTLASVLISCRCSGVKSATSAAGPFFALSPLTCCMALFLKHRCSFCCWLLMCCFGFFFFLLI